ncbi:hypothetical protein [Cellulomonas aerilata]|uniref:Uncharacterized protein n=1 Tax=Cellulomonas aerilata TaxID=515326 RepID=A0A512D9A4_9CELL|nr:hypothetical protein [Cellulomonas aerilata]GEO33039.1 hypothetical protein CAE01nite_07640 [Cellulomonas aerilata]
MNTMNTHVDVTRPATQSRRRYTIAPTPDGLRGGAVSIDGFPFARDPACPWNTMI